MTTTATLTPAQLAILDEALARIDADPESHNQRTWHCGTAMCARGHAAAVALEMDTAKALADLGDAIITSDDITDRLGISVSHPIWAPGNSRAALAIWRHILAGQPIPWADLTKADLTKADLTGANLTGANLSGADLHEAYLSGANLSGADLSGVDLREAYLREAYLREAYLSGADLTGADLTGADLTGADLTGASLTGADLTGASLTGASLTGASLPITASRAVIS